MMNWSNGALTNQIIYNVPETNSALTAHYLASGACPDPGSTLVTAGLVLQLESDLNVALLTSNTVAGWLVLALIAVALAGCDPQRAMSSSLQSLR